MYEDITRGGDVADVLAGIEAAVAAGLTPVKLNCVVKESADEPAARGVAEYAKARGLEVRFIHEMDLAGGTFRAVEGGTGGECRLCNRLRLTSDGQVRPCLFSDLSFPVRQLGAREAIERALAAKPPAGTRCVRTLMHRIGG
jgi:cyclic pyranopterin phosphate synthase